MFQKLLCSVIIPAYNESSLIERCLDALADQTLSPDRYELIVVDDGSTDDTPEKVRAWVAQHPMIQLKLVQQPNAGPGVARNQGAHLAWASLLLFTDADCAPLPHWIESMLAAFYQPNGETAYHLPTDLVGAKGTYLTAQTEWVPRFVQAEYEDKYDRMIGLEEIDFIDTYAAAYRRDVFLENGGFDPIFTTASVEDQEFSFRLASQGHRLRFVPQAQVSHIHDVNLRDYARRKFYIGYWKVLLARRYPARMVKDSHTPQVLKVQMLLWAGVVAFLPLALATPLLPIYRWAWWGLALLFAAFMVTTIPFLQKLARRSWRLCLCGPLMLSLRAIALGFGFLVGLVAHSRAKRTQAF